jgi:hypothetical protein
MDDMSMVYPLIYPFIFLILCIMLIMCLIKVKNNIINGIEPETIEDLPKYELEETLPPEYSAIEVLN